MTVPLVRTLEANCNGCAAATDVFTIIGRAPYAATVTAVVYIPAGAVSGLTASTASRTLTVYNRGSSAVSGTGTVSVASIMLAATTGAAGLVDNVPLSLTISATTASLILASGDVLEFGSEHTTTGVLDPSGRIVVTYSRT